MTNDAKQVDLEKFKKKIRLGMQILGVTPENDGLVVRSYKNGEWLHAYPHENGVLYVSKGASCR